MNNLTRAHSPLSSFNWSILARFVRLLSRSPSSYIKVSMYYTKISVDMIHQYNINIMTPTGFFFSARSSITYVDDHLVGMSSSSWDTVGLALGGRVWMSLNNCLRWADDRSYTISWGSECNLDNKLALTAIARMRPTSSRWPFSCSMARSGFSGL